MDVEIATGLIGALTAIAAADHGREVCGLLYGTAERIDGYRETENVAADSASGFEIDPVALFAAHRAARNGGPRIAGCYHSHPHGPATPSPRDVAGAEPGQMWLILAGADARLYVMDRERHFAECPLPQT